MTSLLAELRRRNVLKVAAGYALVAWILIEPATELLPRFGAPEWFVDVYIVLVIAGFVAALIIAWVFEITPDGVKLERDIDREQYRPQPRKGGTSVLVVLLISALAVSLFFNVIGIPGGSNEAEVSDKVSVAVLPFTNRSTDPENQFFTDGIHDDLLTRLAGYKTLHVISRTSVSEYRDVARNLRDIGRELGVSTIVEGAVQRIGNKVRVTIQVIDAETDENLFAETYDRELSMENVFDIQTEISLQIIQSLTDAFRPEDVQSTVAARTTNLDAFTKQASARNNLYKRTFESLQLARAQFEQAIALDPAYADAHSGLAQSLLLLLINHRAIPPNEALSEAEQEITKALELDDEFAEAYAVKGLLERVRWGQTRMGSGHIVAAGDFQKALELNPGSVDTLIWFAGLREEEDRIDESIELLTRAVQMDPKSRIPYLNLPSYLAIRGENDAALELWLRAIEIFPEWPLPYNYTSIHLQRMGRLDESVAWEQLAIARSSDPLAGGNLLNVYREFDDTKKVTDFLNSFPEGHPISPVAASFLAVVKGDELQAFDALMPMIADAGISSDLVMPMLVRLATKLGKYELAQDLLQDSQPMLTNDEHLVVDRYNVNDAILLAYVARNNGDIKFSDRLLVDAETVVGKMSRLGFSGHGILDVQIYVLQGRIDEALNSLQEAIDEGFTSLLPFDFWDIDSIPMLERLRDNPRYHSMRDVLATEVNRQHRNVDEAEASGDWQPLLDLARLRSDLLLADPSA